MIELRSIGLIILIINTVIISALVTLVLLFGFNDYKERRLERLQAEQFPYFIYDEIHDNTPTTE